MQAGDRSDQFRENIQKEKRPDCFFDETFWRYERHLYLAITERGSLIGVTVRKLRLFYRVSSVQIEPREQPTQKQFSVEQKDLKVDLRITRKHSLLAFITSSISAIRGKLQLQYVFEVDSNPNIVSENPRFKSPSSQFQKVSILKKFLFYETLMEFS